MIVILKKPSENYEETFKCNRIEKKLVCINKYQKEVVLKFGLIETKFEKDDTESVYGCIPICKEINNQYEAKNNAITLELNFPEPGQFSLNDIILTEIIKKLIEHNGDVNKITIEHHDNDYMTITLHPRSLEYTFKLFCRDAHAW